MCGIKEEKYLLINIYSHPDTDANAEATINRVLDWMEDVKRRYKIHHTVMAGDFSYVLREEILHQTLGSPEQRQFAQP